MAAYRIRSPDRTVANQAGGIQILDVLNTDQGRDVGWMERAGALTGKDAGILVCVWNRQHRHIEICAGLDPRRPEVDPKEVQKLVPCRLWAGRNVRQNPVGIVTLGSLYETASGIRRV